MISMEQKLLQSIFPEIRNFRILAKLTVEDQTFLGLPRRKTHPLQAKFSSNTEAIYLHAEIDAIRQALRYHATKKLAKAKLEIIRIRRTSNRTESYETCLARPCEGCWKAIWHYKISCVTWTTNHQNEIGQYDNVSRLF